MKTVKMIGVAIASAMALACTPSYENKSGEYSVMPPELKGCEVFRIQGSGGHALYVTKCPHADTTTSTVGKHREDVSLVQE